MTSAPSEAEKPTSAPAETEKPTAPPVETEKPTTTKEPETTKAPVESEATDFPVSYIFSEMPLAAYEVTGLGVGLNEEVYAEHVIVPETEEDLGVVPFVRLDPTGTFVLFCMGTDWEDDDIIIRSPSGSGQWEANEYIQDTSIDIFDLTGDFRYPEIEGYASGGSPLRKSKYTHSEAADDGGMYDSAEIWDMGTTDFLAFGFFEIYHPDASQEDTIHVLTWPEWYEYDIVDRLEGIGATNVQEISVEEALKRFHITVSEEKMEQAVFWLPENYSGTSYVIPDGVRAIGSYAFSGSHRVTSIEIPNSVMGIGESAFYACGSLTSIEIPNSVTWIGEGAFMSCSSLTSIEIPSSVKWVGEKAFSHCSALKTIKVPQGMDVSNWGLGEGVQVIYY